MFSLFVMFFVRKIVLRTQAQVAISNSECIQETHRKRLFVR